MTSETKLCNEIMKEMNNEIFEVKNVKFYDDGDLYFKMKMIEEQINELHFMYVNKIKYIKERFNFIQDDLNEIDDYSLLYEDDSDEYNRDQVFDKAASISKKIFEQKLENDNALGLPFKEYNFFYWKMNKILEKFYKKMENMIQL